MKLKTKYTEQGRKVSYYYTRKPYEIFLVSSVLNLAEQIPTFCLR